MAVKTAAEQQAYEDQVMKEWNASKGGANAVAQPKSQTQLDYEAAAERFKSQNWGPGGTVNGQTGAQNLNAVLNQPGSTAGPSANIQSIRAQGAADTQSQSNGANAQSGPSNELLSTQSQPGLSNAQHYIDQLNNHKKQMAYAALEKQRNNALSNLTAEKSTIKPKYTDAKNMTAAGSQQSARNFAEFMAARGGTSSGSNAQAELTRNMSLQGNLGSLGRQETAAYDDIARRTTDVNNDYESNKVAADATAEAERMQLLLNDYYAAQQRGDTLGQNAIMNKLQEAQVTGQFNNQQTLAAKGQDQSNRLNEGQLTGKFNGQDTLAAKQLNRANFESDRSFELAKSTQQWNQTFQTQQYTDQKAQQLWENTFRTKDFEQSMKDAAASRGLQWASLNQRDKEFIADQTFREKSYDAEVKQRELDNTYRDDVFKAGQDQQKIDNANKELYSKPETVVKVDPKVSTNNKVKIKEQLGAANGATQKQKISYIQSVGDQLTDSDYKDLIDSLFIN